jgi:hypothetical protein
MEVIRVNIQEEDFLDLCKGDTFIYENRVYIKTFVNNESLAIQLNGKDSGKFNNEITASIKVLKKTYKLVVGNDEEI